MSIWKHAKDRAALARLQDEAFHEQAFREITSGTRRDGLWAKAVIESGGDEVRAKVAYLRLLVSAIRDESYIGSRLAETEVVRDTPSQPVREEPRHPPTPAVPFRRCCWTCVAFEQTGLFDRTKGYCKTHKRNTLADRDCESYKRKV